ncbi:hypothetical protein NIES2135_62120 (plasmid) [Leptolyngbya boryana NIES-2135]|jgi:hypothetical protein|uniref:Uncharacterized protein n=1 Tax=Leptolyngbya boryana NIES-2135 TaxID=1973484 RepID=A0A1Z4JRE7_LEPBY|nr:MULTISPECIES: hypothetical protein [Leptolyngbya]BAY59335.1 hypothetical protein NIES2135_62120 [Leptolyngbya boryana NIES-2135]MBD2372923.1 hypothetical protein [Leptolyngbya sp. FACHB-238]MBD2397324.1 hypothetical protein [Leptolyngbya sp. FACHB-239]MBD2403871.1 hypothetical protein [Leptolyngbya sp. FACHB-402]ULP33168.1 hypothetical protein MCP04_30830 [Leptolyngbya boryana IU 594]
MYGNNEFSAEYQQLMDQFASQMSDLERDLLQQIQRLNYESANAAMRERVADAQILADYRLDPQIGARTAAYQARIRQSYVNGIDRGYQSGMSL